MNKVIYSFFWLATGNVNMKNMELNEQRRCVDPDGEQLVFWKSILDTNLRINLTFQISPFAKYEEWDELLACVDNTNQDGVKECIKSNFAGDALKERLSLVPAIFGVNSCYDCIDRKSAIRFSLLECCGVNIFERILLVLLETLFKQCDDPTITGSIKEIMDNFTSELTREFPLNNELTECILMRYKKIIEQLHEYFKDSPIYEIKYEKLKDDYLCRTEMAQRYTNVIDYYEAIFPNYKNLCYLLYLIQEICEEAGKPCSFPDEFSKDNLTKKVGQIPPKIRKVGTLYKKVSQLVDKDVQKEIINEIVGHIHSRQTDWDRIVIEKLLEKAEGSN